MRWPTADSSVGAKMIQSATARDRAEDRGDHPDDGAVGQQHEPELLLGGPDCREHAELAEPTLRDDGEARSGNERGKEQEDGGDREHGERVCVRGVAAARHCREARTAVPGQGVCESAGAPSARVDENRDVLRRRGGRRGDESELVAEIEWVLDDADDGPTLPVETERRPELHVQELGHTLAEGDLAGPGRGSCHDGARGDRRRRCRPDAGSGCRPSRRCRERAPCDDR